ncbi:MAG: hypothetical protein GH144_08890 [Clostridia bacterium]|nr:hypothetical protein [Clostridia bacterium]
MLSSPIAWNNRCARISSVKIRAIKEKGFDDTSIFLYVVSQVYLTNEVLQAIE